MATRSTVGGLLTYGPSFADNYRRAATYVDRALQKKPRPADRPVEQLTRFELVINLRTGERSASRSTRPCWDAQTRSCSPGLGLERGIKPGAGRSS